MNKRQFIAKISWVLWTTYDNASLIIDTIFGSIEDSLLSGQEVNLSWFGKFMLSTRKAKTGINPQTKQLMEIPWYTSPVFKAGKPLKQAVKAKFNS